MRCHPTNEFLLCVAIPLMSSSYALQQSNQVLVAHEGLAQSLANGDDGSGGGAAFERHDERGGGGARLRRAARPAAQLRRHRPSDFDARRFQLDGWQARTHQGHRHRQQRGAGGGHARAGGGGARRHCAQLARDAGGHHRRQRRRVAAHIHSRRLITGAGMCCHPTNDLPAMCCHPTHDLPPIRGGRSTRRARSATCACGRRRARWRR